MRRFGLVLLLAASGCGTNLNPPVPPPDSADLEGGVWVAYNYGCDGCEAIRRGDRILAIDGAPVSSGVEVDAIDLADGRTHTITGVRHGGGEPFAASIVAAPNPNYPPLEGVQPLRVVGAEALDRAPEWARGPMFGHAIPALRLYREEAPRGYVNGRQLLGRALVLVIWVYTGTYTEKQYYRELAPRLYARYQAQVSALKAAEVDPIFVVPHNTSPHTRSELRALAPVSDGYIPVYNLASDPDGAHTVGLQGSASDLLEGLFNAGGITDPVIVIFDARGIVRWHSREFPLGPEASLDAAIEFATTELVDAPAWARPRGSLERADEDAAADEEVAGGGVDEAAVEVDSEPAEADAPQPE